MKKKSRDRRKEIRVKNADPILHKILYGTPNRYRKIIGVNETPQINKAER
jgi:hypothetical protein